ncbi:iron complex outermembrane receptor protein [Cellulophaga sp. RHA19]|uniref:TonB-dependent receptor n=1 Tax=Cellulophaga sp. RHA19 TaxID=1798237 RepID=UPI000C2C2E20|nr:TonB-dependent receptor [Cellulophaga sp. RHA19]PKB42983.1 iron complex outermembrane receptor protein [Cellulophaga sp. RHA19]
MKTNCFKFNATARKNSSNNRQPSLKTLGATFAFFGLAFSGLAQEKEIDTLEGKKVILDEVLVSGIRVTTQSPVTFTNLTKEQFKSRNLGQDIPILMNFLPAVVTTSDAGAGVGYTGIRVRGTDATRVNITINGIPYNDSESHGTFWVNMPDFASSTENLQLQRGVGTSTNGSGAFGASLNILTDAVSEDAYGQVSTSIGSFNTLKNNIKFSTGLLNNHIEISGRLSRIASDGYVDRASSNLESYFLQAAYIDDNTLIKALLFGGKQVTYQSWDGIDRETLKEDRTYNPVGAYQDENGVTQFYENENDDYKQDHFQLLWNEQISDTWSTNLAVHYTKGRGFFEQYKEDEDPADYSGIVAGFNGTGVTDLIRRRWLDNDFYGTTFSANYKENAVNFIVGGGYSKYKGDHFGEVIWAQQFAVNSSYEDRYYDDNSTKTDFNIYTKLNYDVDNKWSLFGDVQYRSVGYKANGEDTGLVNDRFNFINPKAGVTFNLNKNNNFYASYAVANREPNRNDYESGSPKPEKLNDYELGWRYVTSAVQVNTNLYYMGYKDQLVVTGELNDVGAPLRENIGDSYRFGIEVDANIVINEQFSARPNISLSSNKNKDFFTDRDGGVQDLGDTNIAYSPSVVAGNIFTYSPKENIKLSFLSKFVGEQYLSNTDTAKSKLDSYFVNDFNVAYEIKFNKIFKSIVLSGLVNNVFNEKYVSNGYTYLNNWKTPGTTFEVQGYYPQAGTNFLLGATFNF